VFSKWFAPGGLVVGTALVPSSDVSLVNSAFLALALYVLYDIRSRVGRLERAVFETPSEKGKGGGWPFRKVNNGG
jgi:hypothetical protein